MNNIVLACAGVAALVAAGAGAAAREEGSWESRPRATRCSRRGPAPTAACRPSSRSGSRTSSRRSRPAWRRSSPRSTRSRANRAPATFENTIAALERAGRPLDRAGTLYSVYGGTMSTPEFQAIQREMAPKLAAFSDRITQNAKLFARIDAVYEARESRA